MKYRFIGSLLMAGTVAMSPVHAQDQSANAPDQSCCQEPEVPVADPVPAATAASIVFKRTSAASGPSMSMYAAYGMLQALDVHSTLQALGGRGAEANPLVRLTASSPTRLISLKAASSVGVIYFMERLRKKNPTAALALAIGVNSVEAFVVVHNYRVARR